MPFEKAVTIVRETFGSLKPEYADIFDRLLANGQVDVRPKKGKSGGAFCASGVIVPTYILLNHIDDFESLKTLAHEMGHAIHAERSKIQRPFYQGNPISTAETASTFFETAALHRIIETLPAEERIVALHDMVQDNIATVFRQVACFRFEEQLHKEVRENGYVPKERIAALMNAQMGAYLGPSVELEREDGYFFVQWSHIRRFFYVYAYAYGQLISKAFHQELEKDSRFIEKIDRFLSSGESKSPYDIFKSCGLDTKKPVHLSGGPCEYRKRRRRTRMPDKIVLSFLHMTVNDVRKRYLDFFAKRGHAIIPSAPIVPENDPTTLFTSSGMQPLVPYLLGQKHPQGKRLANSQLSFRAEDIEEVGDNRHTTFFEMLGNWSLGDYFKQEQLPWIFEFLTNTEEGLGLDPEKIFVTTFSGDEESGMKPDTEAVEVWKRIGVSDERIFSYGAKKNWWSRAGVPSAMPAGEIGGPDSEVFYDFGTPHDEKFGKECHPNCDCGRFMEIGNSVFMQFIKNADGTFSELPQKNVDFGGGLERLAATTRGDADIFLIDVFDAARAILENRSGKKYSDAEATHSFRIILDHIRAASFMIASVIRPSNTEQGYVLRRLIRRAIREADKLEIKDAILAEVAETFGAAYADVYPFVQKALPTIREELEKEETQFRKTLANGLHELEKFLRDGKTITAQDAFLLFTTYGFPLELTAEERKKKEY